MNNDKTRSLNDFREEMLHEFQDIYALLESVDGIYGFKLDGQDETSLKVFLDINSKTCDYISTENQTTCFVEFSDLLLKGMELDREYNELTKLKAELNRKKHPTMSKETIQKLKKLITSKVKYLYTSQSDELIDKFKGASAVRENIINSTKLYDIPECLSDNPVEALYAIYPPIGENHAEYAVITRFIHRIKENTRAALPKQTVKKIELLPLDSFISKVKSTVPTRQNHSN